MRFVVTVIAVVAACFVPLWAAPADAAVVTCDGHPATVVGTPGDDVLVGTPGDDVIAALGGRDRVHGMAGNDIICGGADADQLWGGGGNDQLFGGRETVFQVDGATHAIGDYLDGGAGNDRLVGGSDSRRSYGRCSIDAFCGRDVMSWKSSTRNVAISLYGGGHAAAGPSRDTFDAHNVEVRGSTFADTITGSPDDGDWISTGGGGDDVLGFGGDDRIVVDASPNGESDGGDARVAAGPGDDTILIRGNPAVVHAGAGNDYIEEAPVTDVADQLFGESGNDVIQVGSIPTSTAQRFGGGTGIDELRVVISVDQQADYSATWDMASGVMSIDGPGDVHLSTTADHFENAWFGGLPWSVQGTDGANAIDAQSSLGVDFSGLGGDDSFTGSPYDDTFDGGVGGTDVSFGMGDGSDTCISVEVFYKADCESITA